MLLQRRNPFTSALRMPTLMYPSRLGFPAGEGTINRWAIPVDVVEEDGNLLVHASLPGLNPGDIEKNIAYEFWLYLQNCKPDAGRHDKPQGGTP